MEHVGELLTKEGFIIGNIDSTIIAQRPKMAPYREQMRENIAKALKISVNQIGVKATTEEGLGFTGAGEGISSQAIALLETVENHIYDPMMMDNDMSKCQRCQGCHKE
jgi:2-C-methyl-D-erythritol 2,4-cyclodiphosphate synthase